MKVVLIGSAAPLDEKAVAAVAFEIAMLEVESEDREYREAMDQLAEKCKSMFKPLNKDQP